MQPPDDLLYDMVPIPGEGDQNVVEYPDDVSPDQNIVYDMGYKIGVTVEEPAPVPWWVWALLALGAYKVFKK